MFSPIYRGLNDGPFAFDHIKLNSNGRQGCENIAEHNHAIGLKSSPRLERKFQSNIGCFWSLSETQLIWIPANLDTQQALCSHKFSVRTTGPFYGGFSVVLQKCKESWPAKQKYDWNLPQFVVSQVSESSTRVCFLVRKLQHIVEAFVDQNS